MLGFTFVSLQQRLPRLRLHHRYILRIDCATGIDIKAEIAAIHGLGHVRLCAANVCHAEAAGVIGVTNEEADLGLPWAIVRNFLRRRLHPIVAFSPRERICSWN